MKSSPAHPWTVSAYARSLEARFGYAAIVTRIRAIARAHVLELAKSHERHPMVQNTLRLIEIRDRFKGQRAALFWPEDFLSKPPKTSKSTARKKSPAKKTQTRTTARIAPRRSPRS